MNSKIGKSVGNMKKYKYLVVNGCSQTIGQNCVVEETWPVKLSKKLGLLNCIQPNNPKTTMLHTGENKIFLIRFS